MFSMGFCFWYRVAWSVFMWKSGRLKKAKTTYCHQCHLSRNGLNPRRVRMKLRITDVSELEDLVDSNCMDEDQKIEDKEKSSKWKIIFLFHKFEMLMRYSNRNNFLRSRLLLIVRAK